MRYNFISKKSIHNFVHDTCQNRYGNSIIGYRNILLHSLTHARHHMALGEHACPAMYHKIKPRKVIGEIITRNNGNRESFTKLVAQHSWQLHTPYIFVLRYVRASLCNKYPSITRQLHQRLCTFAEYIDITFLACHKHRERCQTGTLRFQFLNQSKYL